MLWQTSIHPNGYTLILEGNGGISGSVKGSAKVRLSEDAGSTLISYEVEAQVGGRMAQLGGPIIDATAKQLAGKFFGRFGEIVGEAAKPAEPARAKAAASPISAIGAPAARAARLRLRAVSHRLDTGDRCRGARRLPCRSRPGAAGSDWAGLAIGLLLIVVAGAAFEYGRRSAAPVVVLDSALLRRLIEGAKE